MVERMEVEATAAAPQREPGEELCLELVGAVLIERHVLVSHEFQKAVRQRDLLEFHLEDGVPGFGYKALRIALRVGKVGRQFVDALVVQGHHIAVCT